MSVVDRFAELKARELSRRDRGRVAAPPVPVPDLSVLVAAELSRRDRVRSDEEFAAGRARFVGGPCWGCGSVFSSVVQDYAGEAGSAAVRSEEVPGWRAAGAGRAVCFVCDLDRHFGGLVLSDQDWKGGVVLELLRAAGEAGHWIAPAVGARLAGAGVAVFWGEFGGGLATHTSDGPVWERFGHVDLGAVVGVLAPPRPNYRTGVACQGCGESKMWLYNPGTSEDVAGPDGVWLTQTTPPSTWCASCGYELPVSAGDRRHPERAAIPSWLGQIDPFNPGPGR